MTILVCVQIQLLLGSSLGFAENQCTVPGTEIGCSVLVSNLPWKFNITTMDDGDKRFIVFQSQEKAGQSGVYLKISLDVDSYKSEVAATTAYAGIYDKSDPDMGLSYSWDFVTVRGIHLFRLHADCVLAEQHFRSIVETFMDVVRPSVSQVGASFFCRCGGGCSQLR